MLDYAASAIVYWPADRLRAQFEARCDATGDDPDIDITRLLGAAADPEQFWDRVRTNASALKRLPSVDGSAPGPPTTPHRWGRGPTLGTYCPNIDT